MKIRKLTIEVPEDLLAKATAATGQGITLKPVRKGLELVATTGAYAALRRLKKQSHLYR